MLIGRDNEVVVWIVSRPCEITIVGVVGKQIVHAEIETLEHRSRKEFASPTPAEPAEETVWRVVPSPAFPDLGNKIIGFGDLI